MERGAKHWGPALKKTESDSSRLLKRIDGLRKDLAAGRPVAGLEADIAMAAEDHARNRALFEKTLEEMEILREVAEAEEFLSALEEDRAALREAAALSREGAAAMKRNREAWQSAISEFDRVRKALRRGYAHFYEENGVPGWMVIGRDEQAVVSPEKNLPEEFGSWPRLSCAWRGASHQT